VFDGASADNDLAVTGSKILQAQFESALNHSSTPFALKPMTGGSDYYPFALNGIPANGLATGAGEIKTTEDRTLFGRVPERASVLCVCACYCGFLCCV
jgi:hypothetical protein